MISKVTAGASVFIVTFYKQGRKPSPSSTNVQTIMGLFDSIQFAF